MKKVNSRSGNKQKTQKKAKERGDTTKRARKNTVGTGRKKSKHPALRVEALERASRFQAISDIADERDRRIAMQAFERNYVNSELRGKEPSLQKQAWIGCQYKDSIERTVAFA